MKFRNTLILLLLVAGVGAWLLLVENDRPGARESKEGEKRLAQIERATIDAISIRNAEAKIELRKKDNNWFLEEPVKDRADSLAVSQLFTTMEGLHHTAAIDPNAKDVDQKLVKESGVEDANVKVKFTGGAKPVEVVLGKDSPVEGKVYARVEGSKLIYVIPADLKTQTAKKADEFRDRKLTDITAQQITKATVKSATGEFELGRKNSHWSFAKPLQARGDDLKIGDLVAQATNARIDQFIADENLATYGLVEPRGTITFNMEGSEKPVTLLLGGSPKEEKDKEKTYAKLSTREGVILLPKSAVDPLLIAKPDELRDKKLIRVESDIVDRITVEPAGKEKIVLARKGESWVRKAAGQDVIINATLASRVLTDLQNTDAVNFVSDVATDLSKYGLDQPALKVTLSSYSSENTAETPAGDRPIVSILMGKAEGDAAYAKLDSEPFIVAVPKTLADSIPTDATQLRELTIYSFKSDEVSALVVTAKDQPPLSLEREKDGKWKPVKGDSAVNQINVQSLANSLSNLHAVRWAAPNNPDYGLETPALTLSFATTQGEKAVPHKLLIGNVTVEELWPVRVDDTPGVALISKPDHDAFVLALVEKASQTATLSSAPSAPPAPTSANPTPGKPVEAVTPPVSAPAPTVLPDGAPPATPAP